ncbi:MAG: hypothetical protein KGL29_07825 [Alphaproteobacteria bacterium]|nr:hypothetical protein [Alphaproteobacteria bacterium]
MRELSRAALAVVAFLAVPTACQAASLDDQCEDPDDSHAQQIVAACTALLAQPENNGPTASGMFENLASALLDNRAQAYITLREYELAVKDLDQAIGYGLRETDPASADIFQIRCMARAQWGRQLDQAIADCDKAEALGNNGLMTYIWRALAKYRAGQWQGALDDSNKADAAALADNRGPEAWFLRGLAEKRLGQTAQGNADIARAEERASDVAAYFAGFGVEP